MQVEKFPLDMACYINGLARLGMIYDGSPPMRRVVEIETVGDKLSVVYEGRGARLVGCGDYFIVELRRLRRDERREVERALNALADRHMLYLGAGFRREVFIIELTREVAYVISRDENGAYQQKIPLDCLNYLFIRVCR